MNPLVTNPQGERALRSYGEILTFHSPNALSWIWSHEYEGRVAEEAGPVGDA